LTTSTPYAGPAAASTNSDNLVAFDDVWPAVTVEQSAAQPDPTNAFPVAFTVSFSEPVIGFDESDVSLAGSTAGGSLAAAVAQTGPTTYTVTVTGMTGRGSVATVPVGRVADPVGNPNLVSTCADNAVVFDEIAPR
jgi:hypothetical protein